MDAYLTTEEPVVFYPHCIGYMCQMAVANPLEIRGPDLAPLVNYAVGQHMGIMGDSMRAWATPGKTGRLMYYSFMQ